VLPIDDDGRRVAVLVYDDAVLDDPALRAAVSAATRLAVSNARLRGEVRARVAEVAASRRRILDASDDQRRRLEHELQEGAGRRLAHVAELLAGSGEPLEEARTDLESARVELRELARGMHPATLTEDGLPAALQELAGRSPVPVEISAPPARFAPALEAAAYFVCSESLANVAKYASASRVRIAITDGSGRLAVEVDDDGVGGADPAHGSGLRGLGDRVETLGGRLTVDSPPHGGTRVAAELPLV